MIYLIIMVLTVLCFVFIDKLSGFLYVMGNFITMIFSSIISCFLLLGVLLFICREKLNPSNYKE